MYEAPQGEIETALASIGAELLKVEQIGRYDNFFALGGRSLAGQPGWLLPQISGIGVGAEFAYYNPFSELSVLTPLSRNVPTKVDSKSIERRKRIIIMRWVCPCQANPSKLG